MRLTEQTAPRAGEVICRTWELHFLDVAPVAVWFAGAVSFEFVMARFPLAVAAVPQTSQ